MSYKHSSSGMTLLEVMVALLIFALTATAIMKAASEHLTTVSQIEDITFATWVANNR
ncbi:MAG: type II secretion system minor pseudopilin GspI, partial [Paraglaciecola sp.]